MKPLLLSIFLVGISFSTIFAQTCSIDYSENTPGAYPAVLPNGEQGSTYDQDLTFLFPLFDGGLNYSNFQITSVSLPLGLTWKSSNDANGSNYDPQNDPYGCLRVWGTPAETGTFTVEISANATKTDNSESVYTFQVDLTIDASNQTNSEFSFTPSFGCETANVDFSVTNPVSYAPIPGQTQGVAYEWDFGNGNQSSSATPVTQTYSGAGNYIINYTKIVDTTGFKLQGITINNVGCDDAIGYGEPDIYIIVYDGDGAEVYSTENSSNDNDLPITVNLNIPMINPPYSLLVMDDDSGNQWGTDDDNCNDGDENTNNPTSLNLPAVDDFGSTTQIGNNGSLNFSYDISKDTTQINITDSLTVYSNPTSPVLTADMSGPVVLNTPDLGYLYQWSKDNAMLSPGNNPTSLTTVETGSYAVIAVDTNGCFSTSNNEIIDFTAVEEEIMASTSIYPNPATDQLFIDKNGKTNQLHLSLIDVSGRVLIDQFITTKKQRVDVSSLSTGMYTVVLSDDQGTMESKKLIIR